MKLFKNLLLSATLALPLSACGGDPISDFVSLDTAKAAAFEAGGDDCDAKAASVGKWRADHNAKYTEMRKSLNEKYPSGPPADVMEKHGPQLEKNKKVVMGAVMKCADSKAFGEAMDEGR